MARNYPLPRPASNKKAASPKETKREKPKDTKKPEGGGNPEAKPGEGGGE
jgi:hypothetical protein